MSNRWVTAVLKEGIRQEKSHKYNEGYKISDLRSSSNFKRNKYTANHTQGFCSYTAEFKSKGRSLKATR